MYLFPPKNWTLVKPPSSWFLSQLLALLRGCYMRKLAPARVSYQHEVLILYHFYMMTGLFQISLFEGTLHVDKMHVWFKIANITHALPVPVYRQTDFTPKRVVVSCLHDTVARFRTRVKFSPRYKNRGELAPGWVAPAWNLWWYHVNKYRTMRGSRSELAPKRKSPQCQVNTPWDKYPVDRNKAVELTLFWYCASCFLM